MRQDAHEVLIVGIDKDDAAVAAGKVIVELALGIDYPWSDPKPCK